MFVFLDKGRNKDKKKGEVKQRRLEWLLVVPPLSPSVLEGDETLILLQREELWLGSSGVCQHEECWVL